MLTTKITKKELAHFSIHALACRELVFEAFTMTSSREAELVEIVRTCEQMYPYLATFREQTPECAEIAELLTTKD